LNSRKERVCQIRMSPSLWNLVGEIAQELGYEDARGHHSAVIREMIAATAAKWTHSPYVCRSACHTVYVTKEGSLFYRQVENLRLHASREKLPCVVEMKPEKREYYHHRYRARKPRSGTAKKMDEFQWFQDQWLVNYFAVWNGKKDPDDLAAFEQKVLNSHVDAFGPTYKSADLEVRSLGGRFLTREVTVGLRDYVQWKEAESKPSVFDKLDRFDRVDIPIDVPASNLEVCVIVDLELFSATNIKEDEISNLALEFRNRESARFEGKEVALYPEIGIQEQYGRVYVDSLGRLQADEGADEMLLKVRRLRQRMTNILESKTPKGIEVSDYSAKAEIMNSLRIPQRFLFYWLRWPSPHLGIEVCVHWEKPVRPFK
jgi:hypothetical protein